MNKKARKWLAFISFIAVTAVVAVLMLFYADWRKQPEPNAAVAERNTSDTIQKWSAHIGICTANRSWQPSL